MSDLAGKVAVVTGSARGVGKAIAQRYARLGASVVVNYSSDEQNARRTVEEIEAAGGDAIAVQADIATPAEIDRLFANRGRDVWKPRHRRGQCRCRDRR
ncbi:NAD(P)-dependent dehydrogenase (short-subunit alcohol dehydrogenase family) [Brachybacterium sacelli]|uniref:NAD(P)-dependent dehydrogenase (Short-subunit alcohol dehydrogenase family) n=1 Tax=Brachybacterium sacelli TaxID=173364 RepID=A0ABS4X331_9MICO|nr:SDR family NAD(P)-dependent oxidoreductase [Brachybacterium sacelli]MBP2382872.1 NAD(P)-dependent dehydrogenase (short-subunit alcohol dehydrogenase family) [Brachybacterium sacelli]